MCVCVLVFVTALGRWVYTRTGKSNARLKSETDVGKCRHIFLATLRNTQHPAPPHPCTHITAPCSRLVLAFMLRPVPSPIPSHSRLAPN